MYSSSHSSPLASVAVALLLLMLGLFLTTLLKSPNKKYLAGLFFSAFIVRIIFVYAIYYYMIAVGGDGFAFTDDRTYHASGEALAKLLRNRIDGYELFSLKANPGYFYFNGWLYSILGPDTFSARMVNAFLSSLTAILIFEITRLIFGFKPARIAGLLAAFMPSMVYWSVLQFKDVALVFVMVYTVYLLVAKKDQKITVLSILAVMGSLFVMWYLRKDFTLPYAGIVILWLTLRYTKLEIGIEKLRQRGLSGFAGVALLVLGSGVLIGLANTQAGDEFLERYDDITADNKEFTEKASSAQIGFSRHLRINSISDIYKLPFAVGFTAIAPLPMLSGLTNGERVGLALYSVTNLFFILILPFTVLGFVLTKGISFANSIMLRWFPVMLLTGISIVFMGVLRYKEQLMPFFLIWAAVALSQRHKYKGIISATYVIGFLCVLVAVVIATTSR